jgi:hypothetical protein
VFRDCSTQLAVLHDQQGRHRLDGEAPLQRGRPVDVDLDQLHASGQVAGHLFQGGTDHAARYAPRRPQVDDDRQR